jgi:hypothetical protein
MNKRGLLTTALMMAAAVRVAAGAELLVQYSAETGDPLPGAPVCVSGTFEFNTLSGTASSLTFSNGYLTDWNYSATGIGTVTERFANGTTITTTGLETFTANAGDLGDDGSLVNTFASPSVGLFQPDGDTQYTTLTEAQFLASPDPWAQILPSVVVNADEGWYYGGDYSSDNTAKLEISPVPTPPTLWLMFAGVGAIVFFARKRLMA